MKPEKKKKKNNSQCLALRISYGMVALLGMPGSAAPLIKYPLRYPLPNSPQISVHIIIFSLKVTKFSSSVFLIGGTSAVDTALFLLSIGYAVRNSASGILWTDGKLDCISHQCTLHRV